MTLKSPFQLTLFDLLRWFEILLSFRIDTNLSTGVGLNVNQSIIQICVVESRNNNFTPCFTMFDQNFIWMIEVTSLSWFAEFLISMMNMKFHGCWFLLLLCFPYIFWIFPRSDTFLFVKFRLHVQLFVSEKSNLKK